MTWYLPKTWTDPDEGVEAVAIHYMWTPIGDGAYFDGNHAVRWLTDVGGEPRRRLKVLSMPRTIGTPDGGTVDSFALHHYFEVYDRKGRWTTPTFTEEIVSRELEFVDHEGAVTNICIHWAVDTWLAPTYSPMEDPRFPADSEFASVRYYGYEDRPRYHRAKAEMLAQIELPHRWQARMWGPRGSTLLQQYHVGHMYPEDEQGEIFYGPDGITNPCGSHWTHQL